MSGLIVYTIGHSNHSMAGFLSLLQQHRIQLLIDIRSRPQSRHAPHFGKKHLKEELAKAGIDYLFLGAELGGKPKNDEFYDAEGYVRYDRIAATEAFNEGIDRIEAIIAQTRVALLCAEEDPTGCHRRLLVGRVLADRGTGVLHIRRDGSVETEDRIASAASPQAQDDIWRSVKPLRTTPLRKERK